MVVGKARSLPWSGAPLLPQPILLNNRIGWKSLPETNTLA
jgi:hypothetical protein